MRASSVLLCLLASCSSPLVNLKPLTVTTWPAANNQVLAAGDTIRLKFSDTVDKTSAQALLAVSSVDGVVPGDLSWSGKTLTFTPVPALTPAKRYGLEFSGQVGLLDGRRFTVVKEVPFFSGSSASGVVLVSYSPANGATAAATDPLVLTFDQAVASDSFTQGFSVSPTAMFTAAWSGDAKTVTVTPRAWAVNSLVSWQLSTAITSKAGLPLSASFSRTFLTNADQTPPVVVSMAAATAIGTDSVTWSAAGDLNTLQEGDALLLTVSEPVTAASLAGALHLTPTVKGHWNAQNTAAAPYEYAFVPDDGWMPGTTYSLQLDDLQDLVGNTLLSPYLTTFTPAIPYLKVASITLTGISSVLYAAADLSLANVFPVCVPSGVSGALQISVTLAFSAGFSAADKTQFAQMSFCEPLFPTEGTVLAAPTLVTVSFANDSTAVLTYQGFSVASPAAPDYYRVRIPGGPSGLKTHAGSLLKEDVWLDFITGS